MGSHLWHVRLSYGLTFMTCKIIIVMVFKLNRLILLVLHFQPIQTSVSTRGICFGWIIICIILVGIITYNKLSHIEPFIYLLAMFYVLQGMTHWLMKTMPVRRLTRLPGYSKCSSGSSIHHCSHCHCLMNL